MKTRREVLQGMIISIGGASMLNACGGVASIAATGENQDTRFYSPEELSLVSRLADLIIPRTETPGALDVNVPGFLDSLMADWASAETQASHQKNLNQIATDLGPGFETLSDPSATSALEEYDAQAYAGTGRHRGYRSLKGLITQAYFASEDGALKERKWVATPGRWDPCVEIS
ncbi:MAG: gluconate 2-dehydrogenase subunit 3 family protein [Pseudohongiellaceae bacterium]